MAAKREFVNAATGKTFIVEVVYPGEPRHYQPDSLCPVVRFSLKGQENFVVSSYLLTTLARHEGGLCLDGALEVYVDDQFMASVMTWIEHGEAYL